MGEGEFGIENDFEITPEMEQQLEQWEQEIKQEQSKVDPLEADTIVQTTSQTRTEVNKRINAIAKAKVVSTKKTTVVQTTPQTQTKADKDNTTVDNEIVEEETNNDEEIADTDDIEVVEDDDLIVVDTSKSDYDVIFEEIDDIPDDDDIDIDLP